MAHYAAGCYASLAVETGADRTISADERAAVALAAERSVLAIDPDPQTRLRRAARISEVAAAALKEKGDPGAVDASLRASWYASRAGSDDVADTSSELWRKVRAADNAYFAQRAAEEASRRAMIAQIGSAVQSAAIANASPAQRQQLQQQQQIQRMVTEAAVRIVQVSRQLAESRADLRVLLDSGIRALPDMMPEIEKHVSSLDGLAAAGDLALTIDGVRRKEPGAKERLFVRLAKSFGADVEVEMPPLPAPPPAAAAAPSAEPPPPTPKTAAQRLGELKELLDKGLIQQSEFDAQKKRILEEVVQ